MDRKSGSYFRLVYAWGAVSFIVSFVGAHVATDELVYSFLIASVPARSTC